MKRTLMIIFVAATLLASAKHQKLTLQEALDNMLVKAQAKSLGGHSEECMQMNVQNLVEDSLVILVEAGRRLNSLKESDQDILILRQEIITLGKLEDKWFKVRGFCCQHKNHSPGKEALYDVGAMADSNLVILARFIDSRKFETHATQMAVWALSDKDETSKIASKTDTTLDALRVLVATLKGEPVPWYSVYSKTHVFSSGSMATMPLWLRGKLEYNSNNDSYVTMHILDSMGHEVGQIVRMWSGTGKRNYDLSMSVAGFAKGKYTVEIIDEKKKELVKKEFEI